MSIAEKLQTIAENSPKVYEAGKAKQEYDFWKELQDRTENYSGSTYLFAGEVWIDDNFKPVQDIVLKGNSNYAFSNNITNLKRILENRGVKLNTSNVTSAMYLFYYSDSTEVPELDLSKATTIYAIFYQSPKVQSVDKLILSNKCTNYSSAFTNATGLTHCIFEGEIVATLDIHWSTLLDKASITSLINTLSTTTSGLTVTLSKTAVNAAFETASGLADGSTSAEWLALAQTKSNWTITLS
ncbi:MAG: hypothetical protein IKB98_03825 [Clostridia bacterium]|nr:hypothetical protein [Clostridia bacterium]